MQEQLRQLEGLCFYPLAFFRFTAGKVASPVVHVVTQSKSVADARAGECCRLMSQAKKRALKSMLGAVLFSFSSPCHLAAGKAVSPVVHVVKQSKSVADARAVEGPA